MNVFYPHLLLYHCFNSTSPLKYETRSGDDPIIINYHLIYLVRPPTSAVNRYPHFCLHVFNDLHFSFFLLLDQFHNDISGWRFSFRFFLFYVNVCVQRVFVYILHIFLNVFVVPNVIIVHVYNIPLYIRH